MHIATAALVALSVFSVPAAGVTVPPNFVVEDAAPGANFYSPTSIAFFPDGRLLVAEKTGFIWVVQNGAKLPQRFWDGTVEVMDAGDRGLMGIAVDPDYVHNHFVYFCFVMDPDTNGVESGGVSFGRVVRYQPAAGDSNVVAYGSKTVLLGRAWVDGVPSGQDGHAIDGLRFGRDGSLLISAGDGAAFDLADAGGHHPDLFLPGRTDPYEDIGAFRAQYIGSLAGKILRINPLTGEGYPSNPFWNGDPQSNRSKVWLYGLRNPWRYCVRPGTGSTDPSAGQPGTLYIGDVGWRFWEEIDITGSGGLNFGWPCFEGPVLDPDYALVTPTHNGCGSWGTPDNPAFPTAPPIDYHHLDPDIGTPPGITGNSATGGIFYTGTLYPSEYQGRLFFADFAQNWIRVGTFDANDALLDHQMFATDAEGPVDFAADPRTGDLYYIAINSNHVYHIRSTAPVGGNQAPVALAAGSPVVGIAPFTVYFSSAGTGDPDLDPLLLGWNFGDGLGSGAADPSHNYMQAGTYLAVLTGDDSRGGIGRDTVMVVALESPAFPSTAILDDFDRPDAGLGLPWTGDTTGLAVDAGTLKLVAPAGSGLWTGATFGPNPEAYVSFAVAPTASTSVALVLKAQGNGIGDGALRVRYGPTAGEVTIETSAGGNWQTWGSPIPVQLGATDQFGARAYWNGVVQVLKNGALFGTRSIEGSPLAAAGGRVGVAVEGPTGMRLDDFGGGDMVINGNHPPQAEMIFPQNGDFYAAGDTIWLAGNAIDDRDPPQDLIYHWDVSLAHNIHVHPEVFTANGPVAFFIGENHDDGTGTHYIVRLSVTDLGGLSDVKRADVYPEVDLSPGPISLDPDPWLGDEGPLTVRFFIENSGRMPSPRSHWALIVDSTTLAEGDTLVGPLEALQMECIVAPSLAIGEHDLRVALDTLNTVPEVSETDNATTRSITVTESVAGVGGGAVDLAPGPARPNPGRRSVAFSLGLARASRVEFVVRDLQGRRVWEAPSRRLGPGRLDRVWDGTTVSGTTAPPGLYFARIQIEGRSYTRRFAIIR